MKFYQSIRFKLTLLMVVLLVVPIAIIGIISYQNTNILEHAVIDKSEMEEFSNEFQQIFSDHQELIQDLSTSPELQLETFKFPNKAENSISNLPTVNDTVKEEFYQTHLSEFESNHEYLLNTYLATDEGEFYLSNIPPAEVDLQQYDPRETDWYSQAKEANGDVIWTAPYVDTGTGKSTITLAKAMTDSDGQIISIVGFDFDMHLLVVQIREGIRNSTILIAIISVILGVGLISLFVTRFNRTITSIKNKMEIVADGDLSIEPLQTNRKDELGALTNSFNQMVDKLKVIVKQVIDTSQQVSSAAAQLTVNADETSKASEQIASSIQDVASGAEEQLEKVRQSNKVFDSISESISDISNRSEKVAESSFDMSNRALSGSEIIGNAIKQMTNITTNTGHTTKIISELNKKSEEIEEIITLINGIAEQTNLLSLNAAIEAARAGEHGKGFAVVADEVRKLAEQSSNSTKRISQIIKEIQSNTHIAVDSMNQGTISVDKGAELVEEARASFSDITNAVNEVTNRMSEVTKSVDEIQGNTDSLAESVRNVSNITEQTTGYTQEVAASTEEQTASMQEVNAATIMLADLALELQDVASQFKI